MALVENAIVILMLVEDHLRLQSRLYSSSRIPSGSSSSLSNVQPQGSNSNVAVVGGQSVEAMGDHKALSGGDSGGLSLDVRMLLSRSCTYNLFVTVFHA